SIALGLAYPTAQCFGGTTDLGRNRANRCPFRLVVALMFQYQSNRSLADFRGVLRRRLHGSILSRVGASGKAGAVQLTTTLLVFAQESDSPRKAAKAVSRGLR